MKSTLNVLLLAVLCKLSPVAGQTLSPELTELKTKLVSIDTTAWNQSLKANAGLCTRLKSFSLIGIGEQTHGTHEFYQNKANLIRFLVTEQGFRSIGLEAPLAEVAWLNAYAQGGTGDVKGILKSFRQFTYETQEFVQLVEWVKEYNSGKQDKIVFFGFDFQSPFASLDYFARYGNNKKVKALTDSLRAGFLQLSNELYAHQIDPDSYRELSGLSDQLLTMLQPGSKAAGQPATRLDKYIENYRQLMWLENPVHEYNMVKLSQIRDSLMARNVLAYLRENPKRKVILWAHNAHIQKTPNVFSASMGQYLHQALQAKYGAVGQTTSRGYYTAFNQAAGKVTDRNPIQAPTARQMEYYLQAVEVPVFILDLAQLKSQKLKEVNSYNLLVYGATDKQVMPGRITEDFDLIIHTDFTTGAKNFYL